MGKKFDVFYFSSTHWDKEWYQDFQGFRYRLVQMIDKMNGKIYSQLGNIIDDGEIGDGWYHANPVNDVSVSSACGSCLV